MIIDNLKNKNQYLSINKGLQTGFDFIEKCCKENLPVGRYDLDGTDVFAVVQEYDSKTEGAYEGHTDYLDIQYIVSGVEVIEWKQREESILTSDYNKERDVEFFDAKDPLRVPLKAGEFVILFPNDIHRPGMKLNESVPVKKVLVKILK